VIEKNPIFIAFCANAKHMMHMVNPSIRILSTNVKYTDFNHSKNSRNSKAENYSDVPLYDLNLAIMLFLLNFQAPAVITAFSISGH